MVALRKESVDRNVNPGSTTLTFPGSLSARRAWIEIAKTMSVSNGLKPSLSARRAWIEIRCAGILRLWACVALRKESVDRNLILLLSGALCWLSLSARRAWIEIF